MNPAPWRPDRSPHTGECHQTPPENAHRGVAKCARCRHEFHPTAAQLAFRFKLLCAECRDEQYGGKEPNPARDCDDPTIEPPHTDHGPVSW